MGVSYTDFIFGADHPERILTAHATFLYSEFLSVRRVKNSPDCGDYDSLSGCDVWGAAHYLHRAVGVPGVYSRDVKMIAVGVIDTSEYFSDHKTTEAAAYLFYLLYRSSFKTYRCESFGQAFGRKVEVDIIAKPFIGYIHLLQWMIDVHFLLMRKNNYFFNKIQTSCTHPVSWSENT
jgi:hypothetical protein